MTSNEVADPAPRHLSELLERLAAPTQEDRIGRVTGLGPAEARHGAAAGAGHAGQRDAYSVVIGTAPFAGSTERNRLADDLWQLTRSRRNELLYVGRALLLLERGGRALLIVPESVLSGTTKAHGELRRLLVTVQRLEAVVALPAGAMRPHASGRAAILAFTRTDGAAADTVWFYDLAADGWSLDARRRPLLAASKLGPAPDEPLAADEHAGNNLPDLLVRWRERADGERARPRSAQSFCVPVGEIVAPAFDLDLERYRFPEQGIEQPAPHEILAQLADLEAGIFQGLRDLVARLK